jgi:hypothetical protein
MLLVNLRRMEEQQVGVATSSGKTNSAKQAAIDAPRTIEARQRSRTKEVLLNARRFQKTTDLNASHDFEGVMMKMNPSDVDVSTD